MIVYYNHHYINTKKNVGVDKFILKTKTVKQGHGNCFPTSRQYRYIRIFLIKLNYRSYLSLLNNTFEIIESQKIYHVHVKNVTFIK